MAWNSDVFDFLLSRKFILVEQEDSKNFGDYYKTFSNGIVQFRFSSSKSSESIDITSLEFNDKWYDLALLKALIYMEEDLNVITTREDYSNILLNEFDRLAQLFDSKNVKSTKLKLDDLGIKRAKQMFPGILD